MPSRAWRSAVQGGPPLVWGALAGNNGSICTHSSSGIRQPSSMAVFFSLMVPLLSWVHWHLQYTCSQLSDRLLVLLSYRLDIRRHLPPVCFGVNVSVQRESGDV